MRGPDRLEQTRETRQIENVDILITDDGLPENARARLEELGVRLIIA